VFLTYLGRELRRRLRQTLVVAVGLAVGIGLVITVNAASAGVADAQSQVLSALYGVGTDITVTQQAEPGAGGGPGRFDFGDTTSETVTQDRLMVGAGTTTMDATVIDTITSQPHVARAVGSLQLTDVTLSGTFSPPPQGQQPGPGGQNGQGGQGWSRPQIDLNSFTIVGVDVTTLDVGPLSSASLVDGRAFTTDDTADGAAPVALLSTEYANTKNLAIGDTLTIAGTSVSVVGTVSSTSGEATDVFLPLNLAQTLAGHEGKVTTIYVQANGADNVATAQGEIQAALPDLTVKTASDLASQISGSLSSASGLANNLGRWLSIIVLVAAFAVAALFTISGVSRRVREFGTLKALGWRSPRIIGQVVGESVVQGLLGGVLGIGLGLLGAFLVARFAPDLTATLTSGFGSDGRFGGAGAMPAGGPFGGGGEMGALPGGGPGGPGGAFRAASEITVQLTAPVTFASIALAVGLAAAGGLIAGGFGGWRASRLRPADALRRID
jgi:putative ABC transport system permease protein